MENKEKGANPSLKQRIIDKYSHLPQKEKKIADYIIKNHHTLFTMTATDLAKNTETSAATVVRFAQRIGYTGFFQLRAQIINEVKEQMMPEERFKLLTRNEDGISTVLKIARQEVENINQTINLIEKERFEIFIDYLRKARFIYTIGVGISSILARLSAYLLNQAGLEAHFCGKDEHSFIERLINLTKKDVVFGFSFPPYSEETIKAQKFCYQRDVKCLSITDELNAPIAKWSHCSILVQTKNLMFTNSISAVSMIVNAITTELALLNKKKIVTNIDLMCKLLKDEYMT